MIHLFRIYCEQAAFYGVKDFFYARSKVTKIFWAIILLVAIGMTIYQMYYVINNIVESPMKTGIMLLPPDMAPKYPPFYFKIQDFTEWIDLSKIKAFGFDLGTFFYFVSNFCPIATSFHFNITNAAINLSQIMKQQNMNSLYELALAVSTQKPLSLTSNNTGNFFRFVGTNGAFNYVSNVTVTELQEYPLDFVTAQTVQDTNFYKEFHNLFNHGLEEEYKYLKNYLFGTKHAFTDEDDNDLRIPFNFSTTGTSTALNLDVFASNYIFFVSGTLYKWKSTTEVPCKDDVETKFEIECKMQCRNMFKQYFTINCNLYFNDPTKNTDVWIRQFCPSTGTYPEDSYNSCLNNCSSSCTEWKYSYQLTMIIKTDVLTNYNGSSNGYISLVYEKKRNILVISETPATTWNDALASIGGLLGLWLGGSIISFVQIFYICCCVPMESWFIDRYKGDENRHSTTRMQHIFKTHNKHCRCEKCGNVQFRVATPQRFIPPKIEVENAKLQQQQVTTKIDTLDEKVKNMDVKLNQLLKGGKI